MQIQLPASARTHEYTARVGDMTPEMYSSSLLKTSESAARGRPQFATGPQKWVPTVSYPLCCSSWGLTEEVLASGGGLDPVHKLLCAVCQLGVLQHIAAVDSVLISGGG